MNKIFKLVFSIAILSSLTVSQLPSSAACQMIDGGFLAKTCSMRCCASHMPMSKCPFLKVAASRDLIANSVPTFEDTLQPLHTMGFSAFPAPQRIVTLVMQVVETIQFLIAGPAQAVRAPPTDVHLLAA